MAKRDSITPDSGPESPSGTSELDIDAEVAAMQQQTVKQLQRQYEELLNEEARSGNKIWLIKRIAWRMQANAYGDLSQRARRRALELANDADIRMKAPSKNRQTVHERQKQPPQRRLFLFPERIVNQYPERF